ncbi:MAG TPA: hypothetical protein VEF71_13055 [Streptosporangiaceae bacterium]|nr:hypothetical protein [Streptosporangiaceae bacterium]
MSTTARAAEPARRFWLASPATVLVVLGGLVLALIAAEWPLAGLARVSVNAITGGAPWWVFAPFGVVGFVIAWRRPGNALGWCLVGVAVAGALSDDGSLYAIAAYRLRHGTLPLGWTAMLAQPGWAIGIVLFGVAVLIFPDGRPASPLLRWVLWLYLAPALVWMGSAYVLTLEAIVRHAIRVDSGGNLLILDNGSNSPGWWNVLQDATFVAIGLGSLLVLAGQVASFRRASGERRQQLKWLLGGFATCLAGGIVALALGSQPGAWGVVGHVVVILAVLAVPVTMGVAILKYRLYDIDRIISRTVAYAIITGLLVGMYAGLVLLATHVLSLHTPVAVAAATLAAAAFFSPLRRRVQQVVDRRFNRARYDADQTVAAFAARLKDAVDLDSVRDDLAGVVNRALEPAHISVWISHRG